MEVSQYNVLGAEILKISIYIDALSYIKVRVKEREGRTPESVQMTESDKREKPF